MSALLNDVITRKHNDLSWFMFISSDHSKLSVNGMSSFSVEQEGSKRANDSFTMHVVAILYLIRHTSLECLINVYIYTGNTTNRIDSFIQLRQNFLPLFTL